MQMKAACEPNFMQLASAPYYSSAIERLKPCYIISSLSATANALVNVSPAPVVSTISNEGWSAKLTAGT